MKQKSISLPWSGVNNMSLFQGLENTSHRSQAIFRNILLAMSEPGTIVTIADSPTWENLTAASTGVLLTLCDQNTGVYFSPALHKEAVVHAMQFHTQATISKANAAQFAFINQTDPLDVDDFHQGNELFPEQSTTVVVQVESLTHGIPITLSGAGIQSTTTVSPTIPTALLDYYQTQNTRYPLGIDTLLASGDQLMAIPRSTHVVLASPNQEAH